MNTTKEQRETLDAEVFKIILALERSRNHEILESVRASAWPKKRLSHDTKYRLLDRSIQRLRKKGRIRFLFMERQWEVVKESVR